VFSTGIIILKAFNSYSESDIIGLNRKAEKVEEIIEELDSVKL